MNTSSGTESTKGWVHCLVGAFSLEVEWEMPPGELLVLFGPSGAGKTTTLRAIAGLVQPLRGHIEVAGRVVYDSSAKLWVPAHQRRVGYLTQQYHLFPHLNVAENIAYGVSGRGSAQAKEGVQTLIQALHLEGLERRHPWELSGGQQQRVALARALAPRPDALLLDEPFGSLDAELRRALRRELRSTLAQANIPAMLVTHDKEEALALGDAVQVIDGGKTLARGRPLEILGQPAQSGVARLVGVENLLSMRVDSRRPQDGTMVCVPVEPPPERDPSVRVEVPLGHMDEGDPLTVGIRSSDVILATDQLQSSSARNQLPGVVTTVELRPPGYEVTLDCQGILLRCHITGSSMVEMQIEPGLPLWAVFKASSCFLVQEDKQDSSTATPPPG